MPIIFGRKLGINVMLGLSKAAKKIFGSPNDRKIKAALPLVSAINLLEAEYQALSDQQIKDKTILEVGPGTGNLTTFILNKKILLLLDQLTINKKL